MYIYHEAIKNFVDCYYSNINIEYICFFRMCLNRIKKLSTFLLLLFSFYTFTHKFIMWCVLCTYNKIQWIVKVYISFYFEINTQSRYSSLREAIKANSITTKETNVIQRMRVDCIVYTLPLIIEFSHFVYIWLTIFLIIGQTFEIKIVRRVKFFQKFKKKYSLNTCNNNLVAFKND